MIAKNFNKLREKMTSGSRKRAEERAHQMLWVSELTDILGKKLTAYIGGASSTKTVDAWITGESTPEEPDKLELAWGLAKIIAAAEDPKVAQMWFQSASYLLRDVEPSLADKSPARMIREGQPDELAPYLWACAYGLFNILACVD